MPANERIRLRSGVGICIQNCADEADRTYGVELHPPSLVLRNYFGKPRNSSVAVPAKGSVAVIEFWLHPGSDRDFTLGERPRCVRATQVYSPLVATLNSLIDTRRRRDYAQRPQLSMFFSTFPNVLIAHYVGVQALAWQGGRSAEAPKHAVGSRRPGGHRPLRSDSQ
jgi:hypothetical protein